ncbi:glutaredoxin [Actinomortierella wolfii]|nr:glutaredoxin [Actinomortierella wolfii]
MTSANIKALVDKLIRENIIMFFGKSYCPYCLNAKRVLKEKGLTFKVFEIDLEPNGAEVQDYLQVKSGQRTVPNIFIRGQHLGGNSDLVAAVENGKLDRMLKGREDL